MPHNYTDTELCIHHPWPLCQTHFIFHIFHYSYRGERDEGSKSVEWLNVPVSICPCSTNLSTKRRRLSQGQWDLLGMYVFCGCMCSVLFLFCFLGGVTEFRSSIIPDWHQLDSEVFTAAMPASASDSWDRRICDVSSLGQQMSVNFL